TGPAALTNTLSPPHLDSTVANAASTDARTVRSVTMPMESGAPSAPRRTAAVSRTLCVLAKSATRAPSPAKLSAAASPMPVDPPLTTAEAPDNPRSMFLLHRLSVHLAAVSAFSGFGVQRSLRRY